MKRPRISLTTKALLATAVLLLPILVTFLAGFKQNRDLLHRHFLEDLTLIAEGFEGQVYQFIEMARRRTVDFASDGLIIDELSNGAAGRAVSQARLSRHLQTNKLTLDRHIHAISVIDLSGRVVASTLPGEIGQDLSGKGLFRDGLNGLTVSEHASTPTGTSEIAVSTPVRNERGETVGVLVNLIFLSELNAVLTGDYSRSMGAISSGLRSRETLEAYIVGRDRLMLTGSRFVPNAVLTQKIDTLPVRRCAEGSAETTGFYEDYRGVRVAGASMCMPALGWTLLVEIDESEALMPVAAIGRYAVIAAIIVAMLLAALFYMFKRSIVEQLRAIAQAAGEIASGNYDLSLPVRSTDEIAALSEAFNAMASEIKARSSDLKLSEDRLKKAQSIASLGSWDWDIKNDTLWWSDEIYSIFGIGQRGFGGTYEAFMAAVHPEDRDIVKTSVEEAFYRGVPYSLEHRIMRPDGTERVVHEEADLYLDEQGRPYRMIGTVQDLTERKKAEFELKKLSAVIEHSVNIVFITDAQGVIEYVNPTFEQVTGYTKDEVVGQTPRILASGETPNANYQELWKTILSGKTWRSTVKNRKKTGGYYWASAIITPIKNDRGEITNFLAVQEDVTEKMMNEERINYLANFDELTGLTNRSRFLDMVEEWMSSAGLRTRSAVLALLDIDQFKLLNDSFGHAAGDEYIRRLANLLKERLEKLHKAFHASFDRLPVLARLSGDEFAVFLPGIVEGEGVEMAEEIRRDVESFVFSEAASTLTISAGLVAYPAHGADIKELMTRADAAMYKAKELGRNRIHVYRAEDHDLEKMHSRLSWKEKIFKGLREDRFVPWFQPLLDLKTRSVHHYEALARLVGEDGKVLLPGAFIDIAERFGIIGLIDRVMIEKTMKTQAGMRRMGMNISFGMNLSGKEMGDPELLEFIKAKIAETGADPNSLIFEITETAAIGDIAKATKFVRALKELGCHFSLDDFGVGFTSFTYLKELQVDYIKIDGAFIRKLHESASDQVFVKALTDVARGLRIQSIAEFVESEKTLELLEAFGVDFAQGYLIGKPSPTLELAGERIVIGGAREGAAKPGGV